MGWRENIRVSITGVLPECRQSRQSAQLRDDDSVVLNCPLFGNEAKIWFSSLIAKGVIDCRMDGKIR